MYRKVILGIVALALLYAVLWEVTAASPSGQNMPDPPPDLFATPTPTGFAGASGASGLDALSDEEMAALANQLFGVHTTTSSGNRQRGTSSQSGVRQGTRKRAGYISRTSISRSDTLFSMVRKTTRD